MYKRRYLIKVLIKGTIILVVPQIVFLIVLGYLSPSDNLWTWFMRLSAECGAWVGFLAIIAQLTGSTFPEWIGWDVLRILRAFEQRTDRTLNGVRDKLPVLDRHLKRSEVQEVWEYLEQGRPVLIEGESGSGKSGMAAAVVRQANACGTPTLFLDVRNYSITVSTFGDLEQYVDVKSSLYDCLEKLASHIGDCLLVIDQLDSAIGKPACQVSLELLAAAAILKRVKVVAVSCILNASEYQPIKDLKFNVVKSNPLDRSRATALLGEMGVVSPSKAVLTLSENLFYLSLVAELAIKIDVSQVEGEVALLEEYDKAILREAEGAEIIQTAVDLAYEKLSTGKMDFPLPRIQRRALQKLQTRGLVIAAGHDLYRFRHEQLLYYFYAQGAIERDIQPVSILTQIAGRRAESVLVWILRLYYHRRLPGLTEYLREALVGAEGLDFYEKAALLDDIQTWSDIALYPDALEIILNALLLDTRLEQYFFRHLAARRNPIWFEPLRQQGFFDTPPEPIEREGKTFDPRWSALQYLVAVASKCSEGVAGVAEKTHTQNCSVMMGLVCAAITMPPAHAARMVPLVIQWANEGMKIEENVISLTVHVAQGDQWDAALSLVELILSPQEQQVSEEVKQNPFFLPRAVSRADGYYVSAFVERDLTFFLEHRPLEVLRIAQKNLEQTIGIEWGEGNDASSAWRPAIEPHEQNWGFGDIKDLLVDTSLQALGSVVESTPDQGRAVLEEYLDHRYSFFRRLAIHIIRLNAGLWPDLLERLFTDQRHLEDTEVHHEYWVLMHDTYALLAASVQRDFVERLLNKLPQEPTKDEMEFQMQYHGERHYLLRQLWAIRDSLSSDEHRKVLTELVNEYGEPDYASFLSYSSPSVGWESPESLEDLSMMSPEDVIAELRKALPSSPGFDGIAQRGRADALRSVIANTPQNFAPIAPELLASDIPPIYTNNTLWGFQEAWKEGKTFDWEPVLELCDKVSRTRDEATEPGEAPDMRQDYWWTTYASARSAVTTLLGTAVARDDNAISPRFLGRARDILLVLADDPNPSPKYEREWGPKRPLGILDLAINVTRGQAVGTLLQYALHVARIGVQERKMEEMSFPPKSRMEGVVRDKLTEKLDKQVDPSLAVHCLFGKYFPNLYYLDEEWVVAHLEDIFPRQPEMSAYWDAAWSGYLFRSDFFANLYEILKSYYRYALEQMALSTQERVETDFSLRNPARHLAVLYWRGIETLDDDSLTYLFFDSASDKMRADFITGLTAGLRKVKPVTDSEEWLRVKALWKMRIRTIKEIAEGGGHPTSFKKELGAFAEWVPLIPENLGYFYSMIELSALASGIGGMGRLIEFFSSEITDHVPFAVSLLEKLLQQEGRDPWWILARDEAIRIILETATSSDDEQAKSCAIRIINLLGERGIERYRDLLKLS